MQLIKGLFILAFGLLTLTATCWADFADRTTEMFEFPTGYARTKIFGGHLYVYEKPPQQLIRLFNLQSRSGDELKIAVKRYSEGMLSSQTVGHYSETDIVKFSKILKDTIDLIAVEKIVNLKRSAVYRLKSYASEVEFMIFLSPY